MSGDLKTAPPWAVVHAKPILFLVVVLCGLGALFSFQVPVSVFPQTNFPRIAVGVDNGVTPIEQMQVTVTRPIEEALNTVPGLQRVRSTTSRGAADVNLFFRWNVDVVQTLQLVNAALARVQPLLPPTARVSANRLTFAAFPILGYSLTSDTVPQTRLWELATYELKPRLTRIPGASSVVVQGGQQPEFLVEPNPARLVQTGVTVPNLLDAIRRGNLIDSPGLFERDHQLVLGLVSGQAHTVSELEATIVKTSAAGVPISVGDVASVSSSYRPQYTLVSADGKAAVLLNIFRQPDSNTISVADGVHAEAERIRQTSLPPGVKLTAFYDQSEIVLASVDSVRDAIVLGLVLAVVVVVLFLRDVRSSLVAGLVIPATVAITLLIMRFTGQSFDLMTLGGLAAAIGLVIDDAIVVVENIVRLRDAGFDADRAIREGLAEIRIPLIGSTITPIVVFLPLVAISGVTGVFFQALAATVAVALAVSLVLALTWTPALSHYLLAARGRSSASHHAGGAFTAHYQAILRGSLRRPYLLVLAALVLIAVSWVSFRALGTDLLPALDEGGFIIDYLSPAGTSLADTGRMLESLQEILRQTPEVESTSFRTGLQLGLAAVTEANTGDVSVKLKGARTLGVRQIIAEVRDKIHDAQPALDVEFIQVLQDMIGDLTGTPEPIEIKMFSATPGALYEWAPKVGEAVAKVKGVVDVRNGVENTISGPAVRFQVNQRVAARNGFAVDEVELNASAILQGELAATPIVWNGRLYPIRIRFPSPVRESLDAMRNLQLVSATGRTTALADLTEVAFEGGQNQIRQENLQRLVAVTGRFEGIDLGSGIAAVKRAVSKLALPPAIRIEYGGAYQEQQRSFFDLSVVLLLAVLLVFLVLLFEFGEFSAAVAILLSALLSVSGVFGALLVTGTTFNLSSFMGLIMVVGIVAKNGILLLDAEQRARASGLGAREALEEAGLSRLRPILMTAAATVAGMLPLAFGWGAGSQMLKPLAIAVIGGLAASFLLSLLLTPVAHFYLSGRSHTARA